MTTTQARHPMYLGDDFAWDGTTLVATSDVPVRKLDKPHLSPSTAKALTSCHARLAADRMHWSPFGLFQPNDRGTAAHLVLEIMFGLPPEQRTREQVAKIVHDLATGDPMPGEQDYRAHIGGDQEVMNRWVNEITKAAHGLFDVEDPTQITPYALELKLDGVTIAGGVQFKGFVDRTDREDNGLYTIVDYKTGTYPNLRFGDDHGDQIRLYKAAFEAKTGLEAGAGRLHYLDHSKSRRVQITERDLEKTLGEFAKAWEINGKLVESGRFETSPSALCGWCPLVNACPAARAATSPKDPRESKPTAVDLGIPTITPNGVSTPPQPQVTAAPSDVADVAPAPDKPARKGAPAKKGASTKAAAHKESRADNPTRHDPQEDTMTARARGAREEAKPWEETVNGQLNFASYAAGHLARLEALAIRLLSASSSPVPFRGRSMRALLFRLQAVVLAAQSEVTGGSTSWAESVNGRIVGVLTDFIWDYRPPFGGGEQEWDTWQHGAIKRCVHAITTLDALYNGELEDDLDALNPDNYKQA